MITDHLVPVKVLKNIRLRSLEENHDFGVFPWKTFGNKSKILVVGKASANIHVSDEFGPVKILIKKFTITVQAKSMIVSPLVLVKYDLKPYDNGAFGPWKTFFYLKSIKVLRLQMTNFKNNNSKCCYLYSLETILKLLKFNWSLKPSK